MLINNLRMKTSANRHLASSAGGLVIRSIEKDLPATRCDAVRSLRAGRGGPDSIAMTPHWMLNPNPVSLS